MSYLSLSYIAHLSPVVSVFQNVVGIKYTCSISPLTISLASFLLRLYVYVFHNVYGSKEGERKKEGREQEKASESKGEFERVVLDLKSGIK